MIWSPGNTLDDMEKAVILKALSFYQGNKTHTAKSLGISIRTLDSKLNLYQGIADDNLEPEPKKPETVIRRRAADSKS